MIDIELAQLPSTATMLARSLLATPLRPSPRGGIPERRLIVKSVTHEVARVADYDRVCGFVLRDTVPSTWLHVQSFPLQMFLMAQRDFPFGLAGLVHVSNTIEQHRPVLVTQPVTIATHASQPSPHRRGTTFDVVSEAWVDDTLMWRGSSTYLARSATTPGPTPHAPTTEADDLPATTAAWRLPADLGRRYAQVSGDVNPIHLSRVTARAFGFGRPIIHGMWTFARVLAALDGRLPPAYRASMRFRSPILLPTRVLFAEEPGFRVAVTRPDGRPLLTGTVEPLT